MLSLLGSLQPDPFSPRHAVHQEPQNRKHSESAESDNDSDATSESESDSESEEDSDDELDTFQALGKRKDKEDKSGKGKK